MLDGRSSKRPPLRVAVVASVDSTVQRLLAAQVEAMQEAGYDVRCLCTPGSSHAWLVEHGFHMVDVQIPRRVSPLADFKALWTMYRYFRRERIAVVHTHTPKPALLGQLAARLAGVPVVINTLHGFYFHEHMPPLKRRFYIFWETLAARLSSVILSQNPEDVETAVRLRIAPRSRLRFLGNGVNLSRFDPKRFDADNRARVRRSLDIASDAIIVTIIARRVREKGYVELFEAMQSVMQRHSDVHLVIIGPSDPVKRDRIDPQSMSRFRIDNRTHWLGRRDDVPELLASTDVFVLPSWREGFPRSAIEAAASGKPIVTTDVRGCRQVVQDGVNGLLVPLRDVAALETALEKLVDSSTLRSRYGAAGRDKACREFDERRVIRIVLDTIEEQLRDNGLINGGSDSCSGSCHGP